MSSYVQDFVRHYRRFMEQNRDFDQRLGTVLNLAFQHSKNLKSNFKVCLSLHVPFNNYNFVICSHVTQAKGVDQSHFL